MEVENIIDIKRKNFKDVIDYIRFRENWKKKDISSDLGLSFATVSGMINDMMEIGMVKEGIPSEKSVGRAPKSFTFIPDRFLTIIINIYKQKIIRFTAINLKREMIAIKDFSYDIEDDTELFIEQLTAYYYEYLDEYHFSPEIVIGVGIVTRGMYESSTGRIVGTFLSLFQDKPIGRMLSRRINKLVWIGNDADFAAYESAFRQKTDNLIYLYCDEGLGLGVVNNGKALSGANGYTAELSHAPLGELDVECPYCHHNDCLQSDLERAGFLSKYYHKRISPSEATAEMWNAFIEQVVLEQPEAIKAVTDNAHILGRVYALLVGVLRPENTVLGGIPEPIYNVMRPIIEEKMNSRELQKHYISLLYDPDYNHTVAMGAAETVYYHWRPDLDALKNTNEKNQPII